MTYQANTLAADGSTTAVAIGAGGIAEVSVSFPDAVSFGSGVLTPQVSTDNGTTYVTAPGLPVLRGARTGRIAYRGTVIGTHFRLTLAGSTTPDVDVAVTVKPVATMRIERNPVVGTADVTSASYLVNGPFAVCFYGTLDSGVCTVQFSPDSGTTWVALDDAMSAAGMQLFNAAGPMMIRAIVRSNGSSADAVVDVLLPEFTNVDFKRVAQRDAAVDANAIISATASFTADPEVHGGKIVRLDKADGLTVTLPLATGSGTRYRFMIGTAITSSAVVIAANTTDVMVGRALVLDLDAAAATAYTAAGADDKISLSATLGNVVGTEVEVVDLAPGINFVQAFLSVPTGSNTADPFASS